MKITPEIFYAYLKCPTKCWLRAKGESPSGNPYSEWMTAQSERYRAAETARLVAASPDVAVAVLPEPDTVKTAKWRLATSLVARTEMDPSVVESEVHAIERVPSEGRGKPAQFIPIRFIFTNKLGKDDKLLAAFDAFVLSEMLGREVHHGKIIHGDNHDALKVRTSALATEVRKRIKKIAELLAGPTPPDLVLNRHCAECEFQSRCRNIAIEKDDLSLLSGMSAKERQKLRSKGIFTVTQLSYTFRPRRRPKKQRDKREKCHHSLKALAIREKKIHIVGTPELKIEGTPVYLDVEGLPDRDFYYLIGLRIGNGDSAVQHSLWADSVEDEKKIWREFLAILQTVEKPVLIHYGSYETTFFQEMSKRHGTPTEGGENAKTIASAVNAISVLFAQVYFPTYSNGLKDVAAYLGFKWSEAEPAGLKSILWRFRWEESKTAHFRDKLITYNSEDCEALGILGCATLELAVTEPTGKSIGSWAANAVHTESIPQKTMWGNFSTPISEFEEVNKAARWDYQRDRVYVRSSRQIRKIAIAKTTHKKRSERINKVAVCPDQPLCQKCGSRGHRHFGVTTMILYDIFFGRNSLKRWVVEYRFRYHWCESCRMRYGVPKGFWPDTKFGRNLVAYILYQVIELAVPQLTIKHSLNRIFGFNLVQCTMPRLKARAADFYEETRRMILDKITRGDLVHVDETRANVKGKTGYVWVFTNLHEVVYLYSDSREGEIAHATLASFKGILVSDFYSAYDSLACPQQRCLIHLMRDLNDEVLDRPFDEELKRIVVGFAEILRTMVETIDRHGLKKHFLRKHLKSVEHFYRQIERADVQSEAALRCKERFVKNRDRLFTFLEHDGVPWNNNNAEHAIKAFAALRDVMSGSSTQRGVEDYLILLSVSQTCKYMGVDFLDFLRSGEKDIHAFAESRRRRKRRSPIACPQAPPVSGSADK